MQTTSPENKKYQIYILKSHYKDIEKSILQKGMNICVCIRTRMYLLPSVCLSASLLCMDTGILVIVTYV